jgi:hypothetical protein
VSWSSGFAFAEGEQKIKIVVTNRNRRSGFPLSKAQASILHTGNVAV